MKEQEPKLTVERQRLYAGIRSMATMPVDTHVEITDIRPKISSERANSHQEEASVKRSDEVRRHEARETRRTLLAPELRRHADKEEGEGIFKRKERDGIVSELPRETFDMAKDALWSDKKVDQLFGVMALELDEHTKERPLSEWRPMQRALEYSDWEDFSEQLGKETKKLQKEKATQEEIDRSYNMRLAVMGIKKELSEGLSQRKDKEVVLHGKKEKVSDFQIVTDSQAREAYFKKVDGLDATTIETKEIKAAFDNLIERTKPGSAALKPAELDSLRQEWHKLEEKYEDSKDTHGLQALSIAREKIADLRKKKEPVGRREETPKAVRKTNSAHAESSEPPIEEPRPESEPRTSNSDREIVKELFMSGRTEQQVIEAAMRRGISREKAKFLVSKPKDMTAEDVERKNAAEADVLARLPDDEARAKYRSEQVKRDQESTGKTRLQAIDELNEGHRNFISESQSEKEASEALIKTELGKAQVEAMNAWQKEKEERMESLVDRRKKDGTLEVGVKSRLKKEDWTDFGWTGEQRDEFIALLQSKKFGIKDNDRAFAVATTLLLNGKSAKAAEDFMKRHIDEHGNFNAFEFAKKFQHDEDVWAAVGQADKFEDFNRNEYETSEVKDIENLGWQLSFIYGNSGFAEAGDTPAWERKVLMVDENKRKVMKGEDGKWYHANSDGKIIGTELVDRVKFQLHEVAHKGNIILAIRKRINWEQYKDENGKWNVFQLKLPDKRGFVQVSVESMLDAKDTAFTGKKEESVPEWLLEEKAEKHGIEDKDRLSKKTVKEDYKDVAEVIEMEGYFVTMIRQMHLSYIENYTNEKELAKNLNALLSKSHLTRDMWGERPLWSFMAQFAANYKSLDKMDGILGGTIIDNYLGYYYLSDFEMLQEQFGKKKEDGSYDTSGVKLFNFNGLRQIRNNRVDSVANENNALGESKYAPMKYDSYMDFGYKYKKDANGKIVDSQGRRYHHVKGAVREGPDENSRIIIHANGDIVDREAARRILGQDKDPKTGKTTWFALKKFNELFTVQSDENGVRFEPILDDDGKEVKDNEGNTLWQMRTDLPEKNGNKFADFINYFQNFGPDPKKRHIVEQAIREAAASAGQEKLNPINSEFANLIATHLVRFTGAAARNDAPLEGHKQMYDTLGRFIHFRASRMKYIIDEKGNDQGKAGKTGNRESIGTFGSLVTEPMLAIATVAKNKEGNWRKPILEVFHDLSRARREIGEAKDDMKAKEAAMERYREKAVNELLFDEQSERHFFDNQLERAVRISKKIKGGDEIKLNDFGSWSPEVGFTFKQKEFQEAMTGFMQDLRYDVKSYGMGVQYHMQARFWDYESGEWDPVAKRYKGQWRTMSLAESRYNRQTYDHPDFKTDGKIDPWKIQDKQQTLYKRVFSEWFVAELVNHRKMDKMSTGPRHDMAWYRNVLNALEKIPGDFRVSNKDMWNNEVTKPFLTKDLMKKIKKESHTSWGYLYGLAVLKSLFYGKPSKKEEAVWAGVMETIFSIPKHALTLRA